MRVGDILSLLVVAGGERLGFVDFHSMSKRGWVVVSLRELFSNRKLGYLRCDCPIRILWRMIEANELRHLPVMHDECCATNWMSYQDQMVA